MFFRVSRRIKQTVSSVGKIFKVRKHKLVLPACIYCKQRSSNTNTALHFAMKSDYLQLAIIFIVKFLSNESTSNETIN